MCSIHPSAADSTVQKGGVMMAASLSDVPVHYDIPGTLNMDKASCLHSISWQGEQNDGVRELLVGLVIQ